MSLEAFFLTPTGQIVMVLAMLWTIPWKAVALWKSARRNEMTWFSFVTSEYASIT